MKPEDEDSDRSPPLRLSSLFEQGGLSSMRQATVRKLFERFEGHFEERLAEERLRRQEAEARLAYAALRISYLEEELSRRGADPDVLDIDPAQLGVARDAGDMIRDVADALRRQLDRAADGRGGRPPAMTLEAEPPGPRQAAGEAAVEPEPERRATSEDEDWERAASDLAARRAAGWDQAQQELDKAVEAWLPGDEVEPINERFDDLQVQLGRRRFRRRGPRDEGKEVEADRRQLEIEE